MLTRKSAEVIRNRLGSFISMDKDWVKEGIWRLFLMIKVEIKVSEPLVDGFWLSIGAEERRWIVFKYEKLQEFYFACGKLGHLLKICGDKVKMVASNQSKIRLGAQMRGLLFEKGDMKGMERVRGMKSGEN
ncbi:hypothetical protein CRYUN_Cryun29cG0064700 [Craigia yunnanensis]